MRCSGQSSELIAMVEIAVRCDEWISGRTGRVGRKGKERKVGRERSSKPTILGGCTDDFKARRRASHIRMEDMNRMELSDGLN